MAGWMSPLVRQRQWYRKARHRRRAYVLLETVVATGVLIMGLALIGAQVQDAVTSVRQIDERMRAIFLAEEQLAMMSLGLVKLDSADPEQEEEFGPRYPQFGWRLIIDETAVEELYQLTLEILHYPREDFQDEFDFDAARVLHTVYSLRRNPKSPTIPADLLASRKRGSSPEVPGEPPEEDLDDPSIDCDCFDGLTIDIQCFLAAEIEDLVLIGDCLQQQNVDLQDVLPLPEIPPALQGQLEEILGDVFGAEGIPNAEEER